MCSLSRSEMWTPIEAMDMDVSAIDVKEVFGEKQVKAILFNNNNTVMFWSTVTMTLKCPMDFTPFPFDTQKCILEMRLPGDVTPKLDLDVSDSLKDTLGYKMQVYLCIIS